MLKWILERDRMGYSDWIELVQGRDQWRAQLHEVSAQQVRGPPLGQVSAAPCELCAHGNVLWNLFTCSLSFVTAVCPRALELWPVSTVLEGRKKVV
jgi:hypothetical protein